MTLEAIEKSLPSVSVFRRWSCGPPWLPSHLSPRSSSRLLVFCLVFFSFWRPSQCSSDDIISCHLFAVRVPSIPILASLWPHSGTLLVRLYVSSLEVWFGQQILSIFLWHLVWKASSLFLSGAVVLHISAQCSKTLPSRMQLNFWSYSSLMILIYIGGMPYPGMMNHSFSLITLSKAFLKSTKFTYIYGSLPFHTFHAHPSWSWILQKLKDLQWY